MKIVPSFIAMFMAGPLLFWLIARHRPGRHRIAALMVVAAGPLALAYCALAAQYRLNSAAARKVILSIGAISISLPWFGIYAAHIMAEE